MIDGLERIDTRGFGGYIVGPGSVVGGRYYTVRHSGRIAPLPGWIAEALAPVIHAPTSTTYPSHPLYLRAIMDDHAERVRVAPSGSRNNTLNIAAFVLGQLVGGLSRQTRFHRTRNFECYHGRSST